MLVIRGTGAAGDVDGDGLGDAEPDADGDGLAEADGEPPVPAGWVSGEVMLTAAGMKFAGKTPGGEDVPRSAGGVVTAEAGAVEAGAAEPGDEEACTVARGCPAACGCAAAPVNVKPTAAAATTTVAATPAAARDRRSRRRSSRSRLVCAAADLAGVPA